MGSDKLEKRKKAVMDVCLAVKCHAQDMAVAKQTSRIPKGYWAVFGFAGRRGWFLK
jgi:hypothetical protein